jgi:hypothetical protein
MTLQVFTNEAARRRRLLLEEKIATVYADYTTLQYDLSLFEQRYFSTGHLRLGGVPEGFELSLSV